METQRDIHQRATDDLADAGYDGHIHLSFHLTSIYDHSIFEAFSKVVQKLVPQLPKLENLLNIFIELCISEISGKWANISWICSVSLLSSTVLITLQISKYENK